MSGQGPGPCYHRTYILRASQREAPPARGACGPLVLFGRPVNGCMQTLLVFLRKQPQLSHDRAQLLHYLAQRAPRQLLSELCYLFE